MIFIDPPWAGIPEGIYNIERGVCMYNSYAELKNEVEKMSSGAEVERVGQEFEIFEGRKWEEYVVLLANILVRMKGKEYWKVLYSKSAMDSYVLHKVIDNSLVNERFMSDQKSIEILRNDALRLDVDVNLGPSNAGVDNDSKGYVLKVGNILEEEIKKTKLNYYESMLARDGNGALGELIIVSKKPLKEEELNIIRNEQRQSSDREADLLRSCLLLRFEVVHRL